MVLAKEYEYYASAKDELLKHYQGKFALIYGSELVGIWDSQENAYINGIERFGNVSFLIKHIVADEVVESVPALYLGVL